MGALHLLFHVPGSECQPCPSPSFPGPSWASYEFSWGSLLLAGSRGANLTFVQQPQQQEVVQAALERRRVLNLLPITVWSRHGLRQCGDPARSSCLPVSLPTPSHHLIALSGSLFTPSLFTYPRPFHKEGFGYTHD